MAVGCSRMWPSESMYRRPLFVLIAHRPVSSCAVRQSCLLDPRENSWLFLPHGSDAASVLHGWDFVLRLGDSRTQRVLGKPRSISLVAGSGHRLVTTFPRV